MSKPLMSESVSTPITEKELSEAIAQIEITFRRQWRDDFAAAQRGELNNLLVHFENRLEAKIRDIVGASLASSVAEHRAATKAILADRESDRGYLTRFRESIRDEIKAGCWETLEELHVIDANGYVLPATTK